MGIHLAQENLDLAKVVGAKLRGYEVGMDHQKLVKEHVGAGGDISGIYGAVRLESGLPYHNGGVKN